MKVKTKLIEVALPLEVINRESAREKSIRHGHPSTLHLWWARRPLAAARAVLFAQLVDDPSAHPDEFPTELAQKTERKRLNKIIERLVVWENLNDQQLLAEARAEILKSSDGHPPPILDPFAGGGTIPLEAQRLGLVAYASDLNPVAVLINKALIEIPPKFRGQPPVWPGLADSETAGWGGARGLAADVRAYGEWMGEEAEKQIGPMYPKAQLPDGGIATVIAWIWCRTVTCPNPGCRISMPLVRSWWLGKKKGKESYVIAAPPLDGGSAVIFSIGHDVATAPSPENDGTVGRRGARCVSCSAAVELAYIRAEGRAGRMGQQLMAVAAEGTRRRIYLPPDSVQIAAARVPQPEDIPLGDLPANPRDFKTPNYGMSQWSELFTNRQLSALSTFCNLVAEARKKALEDGLAAGLPVGDRLDSGGTGAIAYADAVSVYLGLGVSRYSNFMNALCQWRPDAGKEQVGHLFARQAIPMVWDFAESNPGSKSAGGWLPAFRFIPKVLESLPAASALASVQQADAASADYSQGVLSTDPPYYDNIGYSDLSDFFYVWLRRVSQDIFPSLFATVMVPKAEELVANPYRHKGAGGAKAFFEEGFRKVFERARDSAWKDYPITVYYAFKQSESGEDGAASTGWETLLDGMVSNGWAITSTWPLRSELGNRMIASGRNALASSIVLSLRPRQVTASVQDRAGFLTAMKSELGTALEKLQAGGIAPVDLPQAAIGPGMAVFSRYEAVLEPDGSRMTVRSALALINEVLDEVLSEQEGDFDATTRFAIAWFRTHGYGEGKYGAADDLARARNTAVATLERSGILTGRRGVVRLFRPSDLSDGYDVISDDSVSTWEALHHLIRIVESQGAPAAGAFLAQASARADGAIEIDLIPELSHLLFRIAEDNKWTKDALSFNSLVTAFADIFDAARAPRSEVIQAALDFDMDD